MSFFLLIPLLPLLASLVIALSGRRLAETAHRLAIPAVFLSFGLSVAALVEVQRNGPLLVPVYRLLQSADLVVDFTLYIDPLTVLLLLLVTGVSAVVHVYSSHYMIGDPRYSRFFAVTALFTFAMVTLVMSNNLLLTYMCWEVMGICSYLLISHWADRQEAGRAATRAFLVNAVADVGLGLGVLLAFATFGTLDIQQILAEVGGIRDQKIDLLGWAGFELPVRTTTVLVLLLFAGAMGKSAQVPFHVWLPFAMEAPTPVSALIHAATMVNAGPFLLVRFSPLLVLSPPAMTAIAAVGAFTALFAAVVSMTQTDIKKILAFSTISQIGFMIMMCGLGAFALAVFHLMAHGFLKGFLFLSTGNALQSAGGHAGGCSHSAESSSGRRTWSVALGGLVIGLIPPCLLFSGPYQSLWTANHSPAAGMAFWTFGLLTVFFTSIHVHRGVVALFREKPLVAGTERNRLTVQPRLFSVPHIGFLLCGGFCMVGILLALWSWFSLFLAPSVGTVSTVGPLAAGSTGLGSWFFLPLLAAVCGWGLAVFLQAVPGRFAAGRSAMGRRLYVLFLNRLYFDEIQNACFVQPSLRMAGWLFRNVEVRGIDRLVLGLASSSMTVANWLWRVIDVRGIDRAVDGSASSSVWLANWLWRVMDVRGIDRAVDGSASSSVWLANWLWRVMDVRGTQRTVERLGGLSDRTGKALEEMEPRTLQQHLLVVVIGLGLSIGLLYWLVL